MICKKRRLLTDQDEQFAKRIAKKKKMKVRTYYCDCGYYHVTTMTKREYNDSR